jgi:predicted transglutaminase-like cysteine proteinase
MAARTKIARALIIGLRAAWILSTTASASALENPRSLTLPATEPFVLSATNVPTGEMSAKWSELQSRISADEKMLEACRSDESTCSQAERRFLSIVQLARKHEGHARLGWLNRAVNASVKPASDWVQYGDADYWASPLQTLGSGTGDCEDYAIVKYVALRAVGVDPDNLRLVIVQDDKRQMQHAVLAVRYEQQWLILDNLTMAIITPEDARNYHALFTLNSSRAVAVAAVEPARATKME